jgi:hypothetical protein
VQHRAAKSDTRLVHKVANDNAAKQYAANAKPDAANFDITDPQSDYRHQRQNADGQCYITHRLFPVNNIINIMDYGLSLRACMQPGAQ